MTLGVLNYLDNQPIEQPQKFQHMNKSEALEALYAGKRIKGPGYTEEELLYMDENGHIRDENNYDMGDQFGEFWSKIQKWDEGWEIVDAPTGHGVDVSSVEPFVGFSDATQFDPNMFHENSFIDIKTSNPKYFRRPARIQPIVNEPKIHRNDPCMCGSGKKYKHCCS